jgi:hypothetical protein
MYLMNGQRLRDGLRIIKFSPDQHVAPGQHVARNTVSRCQGGTANVEMSLKLFPGKVDVKRQTNFIFIYLWKYKYQ